jgi:biotin carboxyl carrier protein
MNYEVTDKTSKDPCVQIGLRETGEGQFEVTLDGRTVHVDAVRSGPSVYSIIEDGRQFEVMIEAKGDHDFDVMVSGRLFHLDALDERTKLLSASAAAAASGPQTVMAEMAGKVVKLNLAVGDAVQAGQGVVVIEAMKMENELPSPIDGVVSAIEVAEGDTVESGATLFVVEPPPDDGSAS